MKYEIKVGDKVNGFKFSGAEFPDIEYSEEMDYYVGKVGEVVDVLSERFYVKFSDGNSWYYPYSLSHLAKIEENGSKETSPFKVGQTVWDVLYGEGKIIEINVGDEYPVVVSFVKAQEVMSYRYNGKMHNDYARTLFFSKPKIIADEKPKFTPVLEYGDVLIAVGNDGDVKGLVEMDVVHSEDETHIECSEFSYMKESWDFYRIGEKVVFN